VIAPLTYAREGVIAITQIEEFAFKDEARSLSGQHYDLLIRA
jgi:hypothetical protein